MTPPASGAMTGAIRAGHTMKDMSRMIWPFSARPSTTIRPTGTIIAPPAPWTMRRADQLGEASCSARSPARRAVKIAMADEEDPPRPEAQRSSSR